ncbi:MerR family transcriptional regulator [Zhihengliuella flava]|uniref:DNA-binding transcriptional MerR regulator n=1 Tax=Zhihengliuella flava TaxID=1285193 RepID=A0A931GFQ8_9MICC|nr:MerR family transcriptional regulator [Zhihengliuella flava]MBG6084932.1 DNA-binding transcriptional MerR regulator [Zhihengliuella flava]
MQIGELAEAVGLSLRTIRHYDDVGLLPASRTEGGYRHYSESDLQRMLTIRTLKPLGYSLEQMREILDAMDARAADPADEAARAHLLELAEGLAARRDRMATDLERATALVERLGGDDQGPAGKA